MKTIAVIGSGQMGNGIAHVFAQSGYQVSLVDVREEALSKAMETIARNMDRQVSKGSLSEEEKSGLIIQIKYDHRPCEGCTIGRPCCRGCHRTSRPEVEDFR